MASPQDVKIGIKKHGKKYFFNTFIEVLEFLFNLALFILTFRHLLITADKGDGISQRQRFTKWSWVDTT